MTMLRPLLFFSLIASATTALAQSAAPMLIPFQGRVTDQQGVPRPNGSYTLIFNLYDQAVGGNNLWTERHEKVGLINGMVNVFLGSIQPLDSPAPGVDFSSTRYLGIAVDADGNANTADPEMVPRQMIIPAFWAQNSSKLAGENWIPLFGVNSPVGPLPAKKLETEGITATQIAPRTITATRIVADSLTGAEIKDGSLTGAEIASRGVSGTNIALGSIMEEHLAIGSISQAKRESAAAQQNAKLGQLALSPVNSRQVIPEKTTQKLNELEVTLDVTGRRPVWIGLNNNHGSGGFSWLLGAPTTTTNGMQYNVQLYSDETILCKLTTASPQALYSPPTCFWTIASTLPAGVHRFTVRIETEAGSQVVLENIVLIAYEL